jgi:hypothetical protein
MTSREIIMLRIDKISLFGEISSFLVPRFSFHDYAGGARGPRENSTLHLSGGYDFFYLEQRCGTNNAMSRSRGRKDSTKTQQKPPGNLAAFVVL